MKTFKGSINDTKATLIKKAENNAWENYDAGLRRGREQIFKAMREDVQLVEEYAKAIRHTYELEWDIVNSIPFDGDGVE